MKKGIDISTFQDNVNYNNLKNDGIEFVIIRCGYGKHLTQKDKLFEKHYEGCKNAGLKVGAYLYSYGQSVEDSKLEADNCLNFIKGKIFELPIFYDLEDISQTKLEKSTITQMAKTFCNRIKQAGYEVGIYANLHWYKNYLEVSELLNYKIWLAQWGVNNHSADFRVDFWQYTSDGKIQSINGRVDMNYSLIELEENRYEPHIETEQKPFTVKVNKPIANVRTEPSTKTGQLVKQPSGRTHLIKGTTFQAIDIVKGEKVDGIDTWYKSAKGNYVWSYGLERI